MKYYIQFPILKNICNLNCTYCFHFENFKNPKDYSLGFELEDFSKWRDKFLRNAKEILIHFHGSEPFLDENTELIIKFIETNRNTIQTYDFLSNGLSSLENYKEVLEPFKEKIKRIGFTFHRTMLSKEQVEQFKETVLYVKSFNIPIYVKELLFTDYREEIRKNIEFWKQYDIPVKVQDFKGIGGKNSDEYSKYTQDDLDLIDEEYRHSKDKFCECLSGYKQILIFGYDNMAGLVCGCWRDQKIVGNIKEMWYNKNYSVDRKLNSSERIVIGVPENYYSDK